MFIHNPFLTGILDQMIEIHIMEESKQVDAVRDEVEQYFYFSHSNYGSKQLCFRERIFFDNHETN